MTKNSGIDPIKGHTENSKQLNSFMIGSFVIFVFLLSAISNFTGVQSLLIKLAFLSTYLSLTLFGVGFILSSKFWKDRAKANCYNEEIKNLENERSKEDNKEKIIELTVNIEKNKYIKIKYEKFGIINKIARIIDQISLYFVIISIILITIGVLL